MGRLLLFFLLFCSFFLEITVTTIPLLLLVFLFFWIVTRDPIIFIAAFVMGILFDIQRLGIIGSSSLFFVLFLGVIVLYERKFEIETFPFIFVSSTIGSFLFLLLLGFHHIVEQSLLTGVIAVVLFWALIKLNTEKTKEFSIIHNS